MTSKRASCGSEVGYYPIFATGNAIPTAQWMKSGVHWLCRYHDNLRRLRILPPLSRCPVGKFVDPAPLQVYTREFSNYSAHGLRITAAPAGEWLSSPVRKVAGQGFSPREARVPGHQRSFILLDF